MKQLYMSAVFLYTAAVFSAQEVVWQKDINSSTQDFLSQVTTTVDQQYLITGSSIQAGSGKLGAGSLSSASKQNNGWISIWSSLISRVKKSGKNIFRDKTMISCRQRFPHRKADFY